MINPNAPVTFQSGWSETVPESLTVTRKRVIQASTSTIFSAPPNKKMISFAN